MARKKKVEDTKEKVEEKDTEETEEKSGGAISEGVLEAFDDESPTGVEDEEALLEEEEDDELGSLDFRTDDNW